MTTFSKHLASQYKALVLQYKASPLYNSTTDTGKLYRYNAARLEKKVNEIERKDLTSGL